MMASACLSAEHSQLRLQMYQHGVLVKCSRMQGRQSIVVQVPEVSIETWRSAVSLSSSKGFLSNNWKLLIPAVLTSQPLQALELWRKGLTSTNEGQFSVSYKYCSPVFRSNRPTDSVRKVLLCKYLEEQRKKREILPSSDVQTHQIMACHSNA